MRREIVSSIYNRQTPLIRSRPDRMVKSWDRLMSSGHWIGHPDAKVILVEFADFECPACRGFATNGLKGARAAFPNDLAVVFRHWPLSYHRFARPAARAAECAGAQGRFTEYHDLLFEKQDSLGLKSFSSFALDAGVKNIASFERCTNQRSPVSQVESDLREASGLEAPGTPAIILEGKLLGYIPDSAKLHSLVNEAIISRRAP